MKYVALVSGGKDSIYSIIQCQRLGHELVACVHLARPVKETEESYMYQTAASEALKTQIEECLQKPLIFYTRQGKSKNTSLVYESSDPSDEVEDLYQALLLAKQTFPEIEAVASGAILSTYQRVRVEAVCNRLRLTSFGFLWRQASQHDLLEEMLACPVTAVLVRTAAPPGLLPHRHLNKTLHQLQHHFQTLHDRYQFHVCGEGGEFETLVLDCPIFKKRLVLDETEVVESEGETGDLRILSCHAEDKEEGEGTIAGPAEDALLETTRDVETVIHVRHPRPSNIRQLPHVSHLSGDLYHVSEIMCQAAVDSSSDEDEANLAVAEAVEVFDILQLVLSRLDCVSTDVMLVHLYLSEMSHFSRINEHYQAFFGVTLPPSRSCVAVSSLPGGRRVLLDCVVQKGSGGYMRGNSTTGSAATRAALATATSKLRDVLHVQSRSYWAPVCVGPYSQVNTTRSALHFVAGQIGLKPSTMTLRDGWKKQLMQSWRNLAQILDALEGGSLEHLVSCLLYISSSIDMDEAVHSIGLICRDRIQRNGGIVPLAIDQGAKADNDFDGYEDEETMLEMTGRSVTDKEEEGKSMIGILVVSIPEMPVGALVEVEVMAATSSFAASVQMEDISLTKKLSVTLPKPSCLGWHTGHSFPVPELTASQVELQVSCRKLGVDCISCATVVANPVGDTAHLDTRILLEQMLKEALSIRGFNRLTIMNVRVYYVASSMDGIALRSSFYSVAGALFESLPATSFIPVNDMFLLDKEMSQTPSVLSVQVNSVDPVRAETCRWIRKDR